jgi:monovalent cation/hydrogen antiporter
MAFVDGSQVAVAALLLAIAALNAVASRLTIPYPIVLVVGGLVIGLLPGMPTVELDPELVLFVFLPPLLYFGAFMADLPALRRDARALSLTATGLVLATVVVVAAVGHGLLGLTWPMAFALGAIVSPTDPIAATAIMRRLGVQRRIVNLVEGESLVNDAAALVTYRVAVTAAVAGSFSLAHATLEFVAATVGGVAVGLAVGWGVRHVRRRIDDPLTTITVSLLTGYAAYVPAEALHLSGVLAAVTAGIYLGWRSHELATPGVRLQATAVWEVVTFLLNATLFILVGLQLPVVVDGLGDQSLPGLLLDALAVTITIVAIRFAWVFTVPYLIRLLDRRPSQRPRRVGAGPRAVIAWSGLRGGVSMAAALALPLTTDAGAPLPGREVIIFVTFVVVLVTVVGQGLTLPALAKRLGTTVGIDAERQAELRARLAASKAALAELEAIAQDDSPEAAPSETVDRLRQRFEARKRRDATRAGIIDDGREADAVARRRVMRQLLQAQRRTLIELRNTGEISNDVMHLLERELDLEESQLDA